MNRIPSAFSDSMPTLMSNMVVKNIADVTAMLEKV